MNESELSPTVVFARIAAMLKKLSEADRRRIVAALGVLYADD